MVLTGNDCRGKISGIVTPAPLSCNRLHCHSCAWYRQVELRKDLIFPSVRIVVAPCSENRQSSIARAGLPRNMCAGRGISPPPWDTSRISWCRCIWPHLPGPWCFFVLYSLGPCWSSFFAGMEKKLLFLCGYYRKRRVNPCLQVTVTLKCFGRHTKS